MARKRHIRWDRILVVLIPLILLIFLLSRCGGEDDKPEESSHAADVSSSVEMPPQETTPVVVEDKFIVALDPGHGAGDGGAISDELNRIEKNDNLKLALAVREELLKYSDVNVIMTREADTFPSLDERCQIANDANADFFVSLHRNSAEEGNGIEIWVNNGDDNEMDKLLAQYIMELLEKVGITRNRGIRTGFRNNMTSTNYDNGYYVNRYTNMPSCLIEMGFVSDVTDNKNFDDKLNEYAAAIARGVMELASDKRIYTGSLPA